MNQSAESEKAIARGIVKGGLALSAILYGGWHLLADERDRFLVNSRTVGHGPESSVILSGIRSRMHGGKSTGRPIIHGRDTKVAQARRREVRELLRLLRRSVEN